MECLRWLESFTDTLLHKPFYFGLTYFLFISGVDLIFYDLVVVIIVRCNVISVFRFFNYFKVFVTFWTPVRAVFLTDVKLEAWDGNEVVAAACAGPIFELRFFTKFIHFVTACFTIYIFGNDLIFESYFRKILIESYIFTSKFSNVFLIKE